MKAKQAKSSWREIREKHSKLTPAHRRQVDRDVAMDVSGLKLKELRSARNVTQQELAREMGAAQSDISRIEHSTDLYLSTFRKYVRAMGGRLIVSVRFEDEPEQEFVIDQFTHLEPPRAKPRRSVAS